MSLIGALDTARSSLATSAEQTAVTSRNVAGASDAYASRKSANVITVPGGGVKVTSITRIANASLFEKMLSASSVAAGQDAILEALNKLDQTINDPELDASPAAMVGKLAAALQQYSASPNEPINAQSAVAAAATLAASLNDATTTVQTVRQQADADMASSVDRLNTLLSQFEHVNNEVLKGSRVGADVTDYLDQRDKILSSISEEVGIRTITRADNDVAIFTDSGATLFETSARTVSFQKTVSFGANTVGQAVYVDGVPITGSGAGMQVSSGRLKGLATVRDQIATTYQSQLDEIARGLIQTFAESDQSAVPTQPDVPGLFTYPGAPALPAGATVVKGLAGTIRINANVDPSQGGVATRLRDGGISNPGDPAYVYNTTGGSGYSTRLLDLVDKLNLPLSFDTSAQASDSATVAGFASSSAAWLQQSRKSADEDATYSTTLLQRSSESLNKITGVNLDEEMTTLLDLERSYQASTKLIQTIDSMFDALLSMKR